MSDPKKDNYKHILNNLVLNSTGLPLEKLPKEAQEVAIIESFKGLIDFATDYTEKIQPSQSTKGADGFDLPEPNNIFRDNYGEFFDS